LESHRVAVGVELAREPMVWMGTRSDSPATLRSSERIDHATFHLALKKDVNAYRKKGVPYATYYQDKYQAQVPVCSAREVLQIANRKFPAKSKVLAWEFDERRFKVQDPDSYKQAFRFGTWLESTDFGFAFSRGYWTKKPSGK
jgi:hypothetical protein